MTLTVSTDVPSGNACDIDVEEFEGEEAVSFDADPKGGPEAMWFCLRLNGSPREGDEKVKVVLRHVQNLLGGSDPGKINPVARKAGGDWIRIGPGILEQADGQKNGVWHVDYPEPYTDLALCYPYGKPELDSLLSETSGYWEPTRIGVSQGGRPLVRLSNSGAAGDEGTGIFVIARQHAGETPGSWVLDGFLRKIASIGGDSPFVWAIPLADIDGVEEGAYGKDRYPYDLNRAWGKPPMRHEVLAYQRDLDHWFGLMKTGLGIDFHAPGCCESGGMYAFLPNLDEFPGPHREASEAARVVEKHLSQFAAPEFGRLARYLSRWNTPGFTSHLSSRGFFAIGLETPYHQVGEMILTRERYREAGERIADSVVEISRGS